MKKFLAGAAGMMLMITAGLFFWIGANGQDRWIPDAPPPPPAQPDPTATEAALPEASDDAVPIGFAPPEPPQAYRASREERRFNRYDRNRNESISRLEMMSSRTKGFRKLDKDGNNLLSFEEWAAATSDRFHGADANGDGKLTRTEFRSTRPPRSARRCKC